MAAEGISELAQSSRIPFSHRWLIPIEENTDLLERHPVVKTQHKGCSEHLWQLLDGCADLVLNLTEIERCCLLYTSPSPRDRG